MRWLSVISRYPYLILGLLAGALIDSLLSTEASILAAAEVVAFLIGFLFPREKNKGL